ncbi:MAG: nitroreductase family protein [Anaerolineales bacterium]|jgi:FMN reductase (NADPH)|nr:nitroreductase family protein [Anaerolineales bacterium]
MNSPLIDLILAHGSCRHYRPDLLSAAMIETIVQAAQRASTSSNMQAYSVIAVSDAAKRVELARLCGEQKQIVQAPLFLTWCADLARLDRACQLRGLTQSSEYVENFLIAALDAAVAAQNAALAAESLGLGICYIGSIRNNPREIIALLELPRLVFPITGMTLGWPAKPPRTRPRLGLEAILHWEKYNPNQDEALHAYDQQMAATGIYQNRQVEAPGRPGEMEEYGWLEHSARRVSQPMRTFLREVLEEEGFLLK